MMRGLCGWSFGVLLGASAVAQAPAALWLDVPFVHQPTEGCGAASIAMVMQYWAAQQKAQLAEDSDVGVIQRALYSRKEHGITASAMQQYLTAHGFRAFAISGNWSDLEQQLSKGRPLIAAIRPADQRQLHYVVIDGVDSARALVVMNDPGERKLLTEERARFEKDWSATHNWLLLAVPASAQSR
jgi:ABC-type bacteriocin/lantibiotic exporter with double-glycine peptidase domain